MTRAFLDICHQILYKPITTKTAEKFLKTPRQTQQSERDLLREYM